MIRTMQRLAVMMVLAGLTLPMQRAQAQARVNPAELGESLPAQEREMLGLAQEFSRKCAEAMEAWLANKETTEEKLFSFLYYPMPKTDPPKFTTDWDRLADRDIQGIEEAILSRSGTIIFTVLVDRNGYLPTHNLRYSQPLTGNMANDLVNNRTKRIFNDKTGIAAARSTSPFLIQRYQRDTGENMVDLSVPVMIKGRHWGSVRIGYRLVESK
jgi:methyl-accepting chemotaxis protein